jgi:NTP pyrophosphatase (non-canonical NTP hydrolase)
MEECGEVAHETSKLMRFGVNERQSDKHLTNIERLSIEFSQLMAMREMLADEGIDIQIYPAYLAEKKLKVEDFLEYSRQIGTLVP